MKNAILLLTILSLFYISGCEKERVYEGIYKGLQQSEQMKNQPDKPVPEAQPNYEEYKREREKELSNK